MFKRRVTPLNFLVYDYESFSKHPRGGALSQFAALRTDDAFTELEEYNIFCKINPDAVPEPEACLITGITPQQTLKEGVCEYDFMTRIHAILTDRPNTVIVGYNNISFDDEYTRHTLYRNLYDPYG